MAEPPTEEPLLTVPPDGWTVDHPDALPESHIRHELTDGALTVSPSPSSLHQMVAAALTMALSDQAPADVVVTQAVEIRFARQLTRIPDVLAVRSDEPFSPGEVLLAVEIESPGPHVDDRVTKPALYAQHGVPHFWRVQTEPIRTTTYGLAGQESYARGDTVTRVRVDEPFPIDLALAERLPGWAR